MASRSAGGVVRPALRIDPVHPRVLDAQLLDLMSQPGLQDVDAGPEADALTPVMLGVCSRRRNRHAGH
jgi:hypothetical protein